MAKWPRPISQKVGLSFSVRSTFIFSRLIILESDMRPGLGSTTEEPLIVGSSWYSGLLKVRASSDGEEVSLGSKIWNEIQNCFKKTILFIFCIFRIGWDLVIPTTPLPNNLKQARVVECILLIYIHLITPDRILVALPYLDPPSSVQVPTQEDHHGR